MNKHNAAKYLPIVQALAEGKIIEVNFGNNDNPNWVKISAPGFTLPPSEYRIRQEPKEVWVNVYGEGRYGTAWATEDEAICRRNYGNKDVTTVRFREVIE